MEMWYKQNLGDRAISKENNNNHLDSELNLIYGLMISDSNGKTLLTVEKKPGILSQHLNSEHQEKFDLELVSMFINAMQKFCKEINVQNISGFGVKGGNLILSSLTEIYRQTELTMTIISHPSINIELFKPDFLNLFHRFIDEFGPSVMIFEKAGIVAPFKEFIPQVRRFLHDLELQYAKRKPQIRFNTEKAKRFCNYLTQMERKPLDPENFLELKSIKSELLDCVLNENMGELHRLESRILNFIEKSL